jgi:hypothetical protein
MLYLVLLLLWYNQKHCLYIISITFKLMACSVHISLYIPKTLNHFSPYDWKTYCIYQKLLSLPIFPFNLSVPDEGYSRNVSC